MLGVARELYRWFLGLLLVKGCLATIVDVTSRENIALPNQNATFLCRVGVPLQYCRVEIPGIGSMNLNSKLQNNKGVSYYGAGLESGQCGFTINKVAEANNGKATCYLGIETESEEAIGVMHLTVARAPKSPELDLSKHLDIYRRNDLLTASCVVKEGRPAANISWFLDDEPIETGLGMPTVFDYTNDDLHTTIQNLTRYVEASDHGKHLKCVANHPALSGSGNVAMRQLQVMFPPLPQGNPIERFGYEIGHPGIISVEIEAHPDPTVEWVVREQRIRAGGVDSTGRIQAEELRELGMGHYMANLRIASINKQDTETQYILSAMNAAGVQDYTILISTSPEPEGLDLGIGTIIGIVAAIMIVLVVMFVMVFARLKSKWCFSGAAERPAQTENSDTESADVRQSQPKKFLMPARISSLFKKKDKTQDPEEALEDENEKPPLTDDGQSDLEETAETKEGVVYAELDLVKGNLKPVVLKNDDEKTEYAEIVYTNENEGKTEKS